MKIAFGHPEITNQTIFYLHNKLKNAVEKNVEQVKTLLWSAGYFISIKGLKVCPRIENL